MVKLNNPVWRFFASVKLALFLLIILAVASILGTLVKQGQAPEYYVQEFGDALARLFATLDIPRMYGSWWYMALLVLFAINLVVCTIERLPGAWRMVFQNNLADPPRQLDKLGCSFSRDLPGKPAAVAERLAGSLSQSGWGRPAQGTRADSVWLFVQKGAWTRLGVYVVHLSILIVLIGGLIGNLFGLQAYVFVPEGRTVDSISLRYTNQPVPLGFQLGCDRFEKTFYPNGMIRQYRADLTVDDPARNARFEKSIIVNDPLSYRGLTFYVGDAYPTEEYFVAIHDHRSGLEQAFRVPPNRDVTWQDTGAVFRVEELKRDEDGFATHAKISFAADPTAEPEPIWVANKGSVDFLQAGAKFTLSFQQYQAAFLLVTKDPGVLTVYSGSALMVIGLFICFFMSHRRIWIQLTDAGSRGTRVQIGGFSNKNTVGFEQQFEKLTHQVTQDLGGSDPPRS